MAETQEFVEVLRGIEAWLASMAFTERQVIEVVDALRETMQLPATGE